LDRLLLLAFRNRAALESWDANGPKDRLGRMREAITMTVQPRATLLIATQGHESFLTAFRRPAQHFPQNGSGRYHPHMKDSRALMAQLDELRAKGAQCLLIPPLSSDWFESVPEFREHLELRYKSVTLSLDRDVCVIYDLTV
jgi:hypothetical protein